MSLPLKIEKENTTSNIPMEIQHYDLADNTTDAVIEINLINNSKENFWFLRSSLHFSRWTVSNGRIEDYGTSLQWVDKSPESRKRGDHQKLTLLNKHSDSAFSLCRPLRRSANQP